MFIAVDDGFVINLKDFDTMSINSIKEKKKVMVSDGFLGLFPKFEEKEEIVKWSLIIHYVKPDGTKAQYGIECGDRNALLKSARNVFKQIQQYDPTMITQAFEEAFFKEEPK